MIQSQDWGGDEFAVLINEVKDKETIGKIAHRILNRLSTPYIYYGEYLKIRASIGISLFPQDGKTYQSLITQADQAMYLSKRTENLNTILLPNLRIF